MNYKSIELHNIEEIEPDVLGGIRLHRFSQGLLPHLSADGRTIAVQAVGSEIRFATDADVCCVVLTPLDDTEAVIFYGPLIHTTHMLKGGETAQLKLARPFAPDAYPSDMTNAHPFAPNIWRIMLGWSSVVLHEIQTFGCPIRPPSADEKPSIRWLAHGSSITMGAYATKHHLSYVQTAARLAGVDVLNKGMSGTCCLEPEMADFLAQQVDWDIATLELGINVRSLYSGDEFERRARYMVETILKHNPGKPLALITLFTTGADLRCKSDNMSEKNALFRQILRNLQQEHRDKGVQLIEGEELLDDPAGLSSDMVHPNDYGMARMAENLSKKLNEMKNQI